MSNAIHPHGEHLSAYIDDRLDVARMRGIGEHLRGCAACREAAESLRETKSLLHGMPPPPPGPEFWTNAYRSLRVSEKAVRRSVWETFGLTRQASQRRWAAGLAAAVVLTGALLAGPLTPVPHPLPVFTAAAAVQDVSPDVSSLIESHTDSVSRLPLGDPDRQKMIAADFQPSGNTQPSDPTAPDTADYGDAAF